MILNRRAPIRVPRLKIKNSGFRPQVVILMNRAQGLFLSPNATSSLSPTTTHSTYASFVASFNLYIIVCKRSYYSGGAIQFSTVTV